MKNKHLTLSDRNDIQIGIEQLKTFSAIAAKLGKDPSTISKEVRRNRVVKENSVTSNCDSCPLLKKAPYVCNACPTTENPLMNSLHLPTVRNWQHFWVSLKLTLKTSSNHLDY